MSFICLSTFFFLINSTRRKGVYIFYPRYNEIQFSRYNRRGRIKLSVRIVRNSITIFRNSYVDGGKVMRFINRWENWNFIGRCFVAREEGWFRGLNAHTNRNKFLFNNVSVARSSHSINLLFAFSSSTNPMDHKCTIFKYFVTVENHPTDVFDINVIPPFRIF